MRFRERKDPNRQQETAFILSKFGVAPFGHAPSLLVIDREEIFRKYNRWDHAFPPYRDTSDWLKAIYLQRALGLYGKSTAFTLNLSPQVLNDAFSKGSSFMDYIHRRVARFLKEQVEVPVPYWFAIETTEIEYTEATKATGILEGGRPHLHGAFAVDPEHTEAVCNALRAVSRFRRMKPLPRALKTKAITYGPGWSGYSLKGAEQTESLLECRVLTATADIRKKAEEFYEDDREFFLRAITPPLPPPKPRNPPSGCPR